MTKTEKMFALVDQWKESGKTQKAFCQDLDLKVGTFAYWVAKKKRSDQWDLNLICHLINLY